MYLELLPQGVKKVGPALLSVLLHVSPAGALLSELGELLSERVQHTDRRKRRSTPLRAEKKENVHKLVY